MYEEIEQVTIEDKYSRKNIRHKAKEMIKLYPEIYSQAKEKFISWVIQPYYESKMNRLRWLKHNNTPEEVIDELLIATFVIKQEELIQNTVNRLASKLKFNDREDGIKTAAELIALMHQEDWCWYSIVQGTKTYSKTITIVSKNPNDELIKFINNTMYLPPMLCKPKDWNTNYDGGYLSIEDSCILSSDANKDCTTYVLNIAQQIPLALNKTILSYDEEPNKELKGDSKKEFLNQKKQAEEIYKTILNNENKFYFVWKFDKRGRLYSQGYQLNLQSTRFKRALIEFSNKQLITGD